MTGLRKNNPVYGLLTNYCGLQNYENYGLSRNVLDELCRVHDLDYQSISAMGINPYWNYNWADEKFLKALKQHIPSSASEQVVQKAAEWFFTVKKSYATHWEGELTPQQQKRKREPDQTGDTSKSSRQRTGDLESTKRKIEFGDNPVVKRLRPEQTAQLFNTGHIKGMSTPIGQEDPVKKFSRPAYVIPDTFTFKGKAVYNHTWTGRTIGTDGSFAGNALNGEYLLRLNHPGDPNKTTTGNSLNNHQLNGFKRWSDQYTHYCVISTDVKIHF